MKKKHWVLVGVVIVIAIVIFLIWSAEPKPANWEPLKIGGVSMEVEIADSDPERIKGLGDKVELGEKQGMLFVFEKPGYYSIWMKDMRFAIDIAWLDTDKNIIHIEKNVSPDSYPRVFHAVRDGAATQSLYVLETGANFFENNQIEIGDRAEF